MLLSVTVAAAFVFSQERCIERCSHKLLTLHEAELDIAGELEHPAVLYKIVVRAHKLVGSGYTELALSGERAEAPVRLTFDEDK